MAEVGRLDQGFAKGSMVRRRRKLALEKEAMLTKEGKRENKKVKVTRMVRCPIYKGESNDRIALVPE